MSERARELAKGPAPSDINHHPDVATFAILGFMEQAHATVLKLSEEYLGACFWNSLAYSFLGKLNDDRELWKIKCVELKRKFDLSRGSAESSQTQELELELKSKEAQAESLRTQITGVADQTEVLELEFQKLNSKIIGMESGKAALHPALEEKESQLLTSSQLIEKHAAIVQDKDTEIAKLGVDLKEARRGECHRVGSQASPY
ncbi:unnamed protein product [Cuscuta campestris]|uniref:Uncharacterized protein n=1 Tax=Cuscuta campestris TaxID=132261 RepID=A0A484K9M4_9ASTE|nr:unnamed protein product [Cuscuta campestris]